MPIIDEQFSRKREVLRIVVYSKEDGPGYLAVCPTLQGCHAEGGTIGVALDNLQDVAAKMIDLLKEDGQPKELLATQVQATPIVTGQYAKEILNELKTKQTPEDRKFIQDTEEFFRQIPRRDNGR